VHALPTVMAGIAGLALGTGPLLQLGTGLVVGSVPPEHAGRRHRCRRLATTAEPIRPTIQGEIMLNEP
jgi:hypothetical protein